MRGLGRLAPFAAALAVCAAPATAADRPPPGAIPGWFDPATGRFEPLAAEAATEAPPPAASAYVSGSLTMNLSYTAPPNIHVEPTDTLRCGVFVTVFWHPLGSGPKASTERIDYTFSFNAAWKDRPPQVVVPTTMPTDELAKPTPIVFRTFDCSIYGAGDEDAVADGTDISIGRSSQISSFGPKIEQDVTLFFE